MDLFERNTEPQLVTRPVGDEDVVSEDAGPDKPSIWLSPRRLAKIAALIVLPLALIAAGAFFGARYWLRNAAKASLPQVDGSLAIAELQGPVIVARDARGVPRIKAASIDDLLVAQGFVTASDRLFQMDLLRRHAAGELAEILPPTTAIVNYDRLQRTLQIRASADRAVAAMTADQVHQLQMFADGVNAEIAQAGDHLPVEFKILRYQPAKWTPRDSILVQLEMMQSLSNTYPEKLARETLESRLPPEQEAELEADLYPVGSWRDHPPTSPVPDLSVPGPVIEDVPLDESQRGYGFVGAKLSTEIEKWATRAQSCDACVPGSNNWVVSGVHTASGKPLLSDDMHLSLTLPGIWYEADLSAENGAAGDSFHVAGVTVPGLPLIVVGHNQHIAWGFTNLGGDVQDVYVETLRGVPGHEQFQATDGTWQPVVHVAETIKVKGGNSLGFDVALTKHGDTLTPILHQSLAPKAAAMSHVLSLRWTIYDPAVLGIPTLAINSAHDWPSFLTAFSAFGGPSQNVVYADDQGHIGYHAMGKIPMRGAPVNPEAAGLPGDVAAPVAAPNTDAANPLGQTEILAPAAPVVKQLSGPISPVPFVPTLAREWTGYIPFDKLPQVFDPPGGVIGTANSRVTADDYPYPITLNWVAPYRNERIWHVLAHRTGMTPADMLAIQMDIYSDFDHVLAQRLAYALDGSLAHPDKSLNAAQLGVLKQAADLLRTFDGRMKTDSVAATIVANTRAVLWPMMLEPKLLRMAAPKGAKPAQVAAPAKAVSVDELNALYSWGEKDYALEQVLMHQPARWLPKQYGTWNDFLTAAVERALTDAHAPSDLSKWHYGLVHTLDIQHPIFDQSPALSYVYGLRTGTGPVGMPGDGTTVRQSGRLFGPSERFTADMSDLDKSTLNLVTGESGNPASPWFLDQFSAWYRGTTFAMPFSDAAAGAAAKHTLTLMPAGK